jgi:CBS-domain-containing membrane protein
MKYVSISVQSLRNLFQSWVRIGREFKTFWKNYLLQSLLAVLVVFVVFWSLNVEQAVIVASIGSTAFIVFTMPSYATAQSRRVIGGHLVGFLCGVLGSLILNYLSINPLVIYSFTVGLSIFLMVALDFKHPPASGTALGVVISGFSFEVMIAILTSAVILGLAHHYLKRYLRDLI